MDWKTTPEKRTDILHEWRPSRNAVFYVNDMHDGRFLNFMPSVNKSTSDDVEKCQKTWPREAIRLMRAELDRIEALLDREGTDETVIH